MSDRARRDALARRSLNGPVELYSVCRESVHLTDPDGTATYVEVIDDDAQASALVGYLRDNGAPFIDDGERHDRYLETLRHHLRQGMTPAAAREATRHP